MYLSIPTNFTSYQGYLSKKKKKTNHAKKQRHALSQEIHLLSTLPQQPKNPSNLSGPTRRLKNNQEDASTHVCAGNSYEMTPGERREQRSVNWPVDQAARRKTTSFPATDKSVCPLWS